MTLEELLTSKGYTAQEMSDLAPMLSNAKFRRDLEAELTDAVKAKTDLDEYDRWFTQEITPEHQALLKRTADAEAAQAAAEARFQSYQKSGMFKGTEAEKKAAEDAAEAARVAAAGKGGVDMSKYVDNDTFRSAFDKTGDAIAIAMDMTTQHMQLFPGTFLNMEALRTEAKAAKKPMKEYWEQKYNVAGKRAEIAVAAKAADEARIRADERQKMAVEFGGQNPNLQVGVQSSNPFVIRKQSTETKQPWEKTPNDVSRQRLEKAIQNAATRGELGRA